MSYFFSFATSVVVPEEKSLLPVLVFGSVEDLVFKYVAAESNIMRHKATVIWVFIINFYYLFSKVIHFIADYYRRGDQINDLFQF